MNLKIETTKGPNPMTLTLTQTADLVARARQLIDKYGWRQGSTPVGSGIGLCFGSALAKAALELQPHSSILQIGDSYNYQMFTDIDESQLHPAGATIRNYVNVLVPALNGKSLMSWNDDRLRTKTAVIALFTSIENAMREDVALADLTADTELAQTICMTEMERGSEIEADQRRITPGSNHTAMSMSAPIFANNNVITSSCYTKAAQMSAWMEDPIINIPAAIPAYKFDIKLACDA